MKAVDVSRLPNPYDFGNPVADPDKFAGRSEELSEIRYYLDQASKVGQPMNLALLGDRAAGKTSLLNMIAHEAVARRQCVVRINLNEGDAATALSFFYKIVDAVIHAACSFKIVDKDGQAAYPFEGRGGKTFEQYIDLVSTYEVPKDRTFVPFLFPILYAKAKARGLENVAVSDQVISADLTLIAQNVTAPIILLFDECNVLSSHRVLLQMLRNAFMNLAGYMLVFTGTRDLFPVMDEVFSPIVRQFKKIEVRPFATTDDTEACIRKPLERIGIDDPKDVIEPSTLSELRRIHEITGGRPYEIQLLCHLMFKQVQQGKTDRMALSLDVLDDVLRELSQSQDIYARPVIRAVRQLNPRELRGLSWLCACLGHASIDQLWEIEFGLRGEARWTREELDRLAEKYRGLGIIDWDAATIRFLGDDFDRLYCRYYARKERVALAITNIPYEAHAVYSFDSAVRRFGLRPLSMILGVAEGHWLPVNRRVASSLGSSATLAADQSIAEQLISSLPKRLSELWNSRADLAASFYEALLDAPPGRIEIAALKFRSTTMNAQWIYFVPAGTDSLKDQFGVEAKEMGVRFSQIGAAFEAEWHEVAFAGLTEVIKSVVASTCEAAKRGVAGAHLRRVTLEYVQKRNVEAAVTHGLMALPLSRWFDWSGANNVAFLLIKSGRYRDAQEILSDVLSSADLRSSEPLVHYNLALAYAMQGNITAARGELAVCIAAAQEGEGAEAACILIPQSFTPLGDLVDDWNPDLKARAVWLNEQLATL